MTVLIDIYRSKKKEGLYLYVPKGKEVETLPETLIHQFGKAEYSMMIVLTKDKPLARANAKDVLAAIDEQGFYLQLPPATIP